MLNCTKCDGKGSVHSDYAHYNADTKEFTPGDKQCRCCNGLCKFPLVDVSAIRGTVMTKRGEGRLRKSMTSPVSHDSAERRAYYVWRLARFHGGVDVTMPVVAMMIIEGDPFIKELDALASEVAKEAFGSDLQGAARWGRVMGLL